MHKSPRPCYFLFRETYGAWEIRKILTKLVSGQRSRLRLSRNMHQHIQEFSPCKRKKDGIFITFISTGLLVPGKIFQEPREKLFLGVRLQYYRLSRSFRNIILWT